MTYYAYYAAGDPTYGGVYFADDFTLTGAQPTWRRINQGLPNLQVIQMRADSVYPALVHYVRLTGGEIYRRDTRTSDVWTKILDPTMAFAIGGGDYAGKVGWVAPIRGLAGGVLVAYTPGLNSFNVDTNARVLASYDYGATWASVSVPNDMAGYPLYWYHGIGTVEGIKKSGCPEVWWMGMNSQLGGAQYMVMAWATTGTGTPADWYIGVQNGYSGWFLAAQIDTLETYDFNSTPPRAYYAGGDGSTYYPTRLTLGTADRPQPTILAESVLLSGVSDIRYATTNDMIWCSPDTLRHHRLAFGRKIFATSDRWATVNNPTPGDVAIGADNHIVCLTASPGDDTGVVFAQALSKGASPVYMVCSLADETATTFTGRGGALYDTAPYTGSIPGGLCGRTALNGLIVSAAPTVTGVYPHAVGGVVSVGQEIPLPGDRSVWDDLAFPTLHARDLSLGRSVHHLPTGSAVGDVLTWNGTDWVATTGSSSNTDAVLTDDDGNFLSDDSGNLLTDDTV